MSKDVLVFNGCDHMINGTLYNSNLCPKCRGKNYYKDIAFDTNGHAILCEKEIKLQQEVLKILDDPKYGNKFHQEWGDPLIPYGENSTVGSKNTAVRRQKIQTALYDMLLYLQGIQSNAQVLFKNMEPEEIIEGIENIEVLQETPVGITIKVTFSNKEGEIFSQEIVV